MIEFGLFFKIWTLPREFYQIAQQKNSTKENNFCHQKSCIFNAWLSLFCIILSNFNWTLNQFTLCNFQDKWNANGRVIVDESQGFQKSCKSHAIFIFSFCQFKLSVKCLDEIHSFTNCLLFQQLLIKNWKKANEIFLDNLKACKNHTEIHYFTFFDITFQPLSESNFQVYYP